MLVLMKSSLGILWNALLTATVVTLLAGLFVAAMPPVYRATSTVQGSAEDMLRLRSADFLGQVLKESSASTEDLVGWLEEITSARQKGIQLLEQKLFISAGEQPGWIDITVEAQNANTATDFANDIARVHSEQRTRVKLTPEEKAMLFGEVEKIDAELARFLDRYPEVLRYPQARQAYVLDTNRQQQAETNLLNQQEQFRAQLEAARRAEIGAIREPGVVRASQNLNNYEGRLANLASRYGEQHQKMLAAQAERQKFEDQLQDELLAFGARLEERIKTLRADLKRQQARIKEAEDRVNNLDQEYLEYEKLKLARSTALARFEGMTEEEASTTYARAVTPGNSLGFNQVLLLAFVFLVSFMLMAILMIVRASRVRSAA